MLASLRVVVTALLSVLAGWTGRIRLWLTSSPVGKSHRRSSYSQGDLMSENSSDRFTNTGQTTACILDNGPMAAFGKADQAFTLGAMRHHAKELHMCALSTSSLLKLVVQMLLSDRGLSYQEGRAACPSQDR